jgi:hypothetical protein
LLTKNDFEQLNIPKGILFYPCCGYDTFEPLHLFQNVIKEFHFCDKEQIGLPPIHNQNIMDIRHQGINTINESLNIIYLNSKLVNKPEGITYQEFYLNRENDHQLEVHAHIKDAISVFKQLKDIAIFFYRGDSMGGLGSGITWLGPDLFPQIVEKMVDGGYLITDGSNPDANQLETDWNELYKHSHWNYPDLMPGEQPKDFKYRDHTFTCLGSIGKRYGDVYVWRVNK